MEPRGDLARVALRPVLLWTSLFAIYLVVLLLVPAEQTALVHIIAWTIVPVPAGLACSRAARIGDLSPQQRRAWRTLALACACWFVSELIWDYAVLVRKLPPTFPTVGKLFFIGYAVLFIKGLGNLSDSGAQDRFSVQHLGNVGLIACCFCVTFAMMFLEPATHTAMPLPGIIGALMNSVLIALTFFAALYYLWTHRWHASWVAMLLITTSCGVYSLGNVVYAHAQLTGAYRSSDVVNATWVIAFLLLGLAAHVRLEQRNPAVADALVAEESKARRARQLEATIPALLIIMIVVVGMSVPGQLSMRALAITAALMLLFALILGAREAWIQGESQRLTLELQRANEMLRGANTELQESEARVRDLNVHLEERVAERTRQLQNAYEELEGFAYAVAHDLKAPLRAIDGFGQLLDDALRERADVQSAQYLARIRRGAMKMASLIDDLLAYSRIERRALTARVVELDQLIADIVEESSQEIQARSITLHIDVPALHVQTDAEGLALVIRNLFQNAIKFTRGVDQPRIEITTRGGDAGIELTIRDNGIGFDMQYHEQIFKLFHRLHRDDQYQGTGIGLALVRKALERMRGSVRAESREGAGATFYVKLPHGGG